MEECSWCDTFTSLRSVFQNLRVHTRKTAVHLVRFSSLLWNICMFVGCQPLGAVMTLMGSKKEVRWHRASKYPRYGWLDGWKTPLWPQWSYKVCCCGNNSYSRDSKTHETLGKTNKNRMWWFAFWHTIHLLKTVIYNIMYLNEGSLAISESRLSGVRRGCPNRSQISYSLQIFIIVRLSEG